MALEQLLEVLGDRLVFLEALVVAVELAAGLESDGEQVPDRPHLERRPRR